MDKCISVNYAYIRLRVSIDNVYYLQKEIISFLESSEYSNIFYYYTNNNVFKLQKSHIEASSTIRQNNDNLITYIELNLEENVSTDMNEVTTSKDVLYMIKVKIKYDSRQFPEISYMDYLLPKLSAIVISYMQIYHFKISMESHKNILKNDEIGKHLLVIKFHNAIKTINKVTPLLFNEKINYIDFYYQLIRYNKFVQTYYLRRY